MTFQLMLTIALCCSAWQRNAFAEHVKPLHVSGHQNDDVKQHNDKNDVNTCVHQNENCIESPQHDNSKTDCALWLAPSTIEGAGMGMFAGRHYKRHEDFMPQGDIAIPIVDFEIHQKGRLSEFAFLWEEYTWNADTLAMEYHAHEVHGASPGFGSAANSVMDLANVEEGTPTQINGHVGLHRHGNDPGVGAFSYHYNRRSTAKMAIEEGQELFVSYGNHWFETRQDWMGYLPLKGDYHLAHLLLMKFQQLELKHNDTNAFVLQKLWKLVFLDKPTHDSTVLNALPNTKEELLLAKEMGLLPWKRQQTTVSNDYLQEHGTCASYLRVHNSTIPQAGRGAFSNRPFKQGDIVAPVPLIHLVNGQEQMQMYHLTLNQKGEWVAKNQTHIVGHQLLKNYCFGHAQSTLLLCPYGLQTGFVNHDSQHANVKIQWANPTKSNHESTWLNKSLKELNKQDRAVLAFEFVATRDIQDGDEILLHYGDEWQNAWNHHVQHWKPLANYKSASEYNADMTSPLQTEFEALQTPHPANVQLKCHSMFSKTRAWQRHVNLTDSLMRMIHNSNMNEIVTCDVLSRIQQDTTFVYNALYYNDDDQDDNDDKMKPIKVQGLPREAFVFVDELYTTDMHLPQAFRHEAMIPDDMFPEQWKNLVDQHKQG